MKRLFVFALLLLCFSCGDDSFNPERRYIDKVVIIEGEINAFDVLSGPDVKLKLTSRGEIKESELFEDVQFLPLTFEDVAFELTDSTMRLQVLDEDEFDADDIMLDRTITTYWRTGTGNPFRLVFTDWTIDIYWRTQ